MSSEGGETDRNCELLILKFNFIMKLPFYLKAKELRAFFGYRHDDVPFSRKVKDSKFNEILRAHKKEILKNSPYAANADNFHSKCVSQVRNKLDNSYIIRNVNAKTMHCDATTEFTHGARTGIDWIDDLLAETLFIIDDIYTIDFTTDIKEEWLDSVELRV